MKQSISISLIALFVLTGEAGASKTCMTHSEAKTAFKGAWLYWHRTSEGRCWTDRRISRAARSARAMKYKSVPVKVEPSPPPLIKYDAPLPRRLVPTEVEASINDYPQWAWSSQIYSGLPEDGKAPDTEGNPPPPVAVAQPPPTVVNRDNKGHKLNTEQSGVTPRLVVALIGFWVLSFIIASSLYRWTHGEEAVA